MGRWRSKLLTALIVYAAGFASAIYVLTPSPAAESDHSNANPISRWAETTHLPKAGFEAKPWIDSIHAAIGKTAAFAKDQSVILADVIKTKVEQNQRDRDE